jgi:CBS domain-containing membrane protein
MSQSEVIPVEKIKSQNPVDISDNDVFEAMKSMDGYIDITPADFKEVYKIAYRYAMNRMYQNLRAEDVMTRSVIFVQNDTTLIEAADLMAEHNISGMPVVDLNRYVVGVISEKDFFQEMSHQSHISIMGVISHCLNNKGCVAISLKKMKVQEIMSSSPICVQKSSTITNISDVLDKNKINRVPVIDEEGKLAGIVTRTDIIQHLVS